MIILIISIMAAFVISFICSLLEATLLSVSNADIADMAVKNKKSAQIWEDFKLNIQRLITVILVINTVAHTIGATISGAKFAAIFGEKWILFFSIFFSFFMILWTEILPKTLGVKNKKIIAPFIAVPLSFTIILMKPIIVLLHIFNKPFEGKNIKKEEADLIYEINALAKYAQSNNQISSEQQKIMERSMGISSKKIKEIMIKSENVNWFSNKMPLHDALIKAHISRHTRYILVEDNDFDKIIGYVNFKDIVSALHINPKNATIEGISRPVMALNEDDDISTALGKLLKSYQHIAVIKNSVGKTTGIITVEDLLETIVGKIEDEYDLMPCEIIKKSDKIYFVSGGASMKEIAQKLELKGEFDNKTLHNLIMEIGNGEIPQTENIIYKNLQIKILKVRRGKIFETMIEKI